MNWPRWSYSDLLIGSAIFILTALLLVSYQIFILHEPFTISGFFEWRIVILFLFGLTFLIRAFRLKNSGKTGIPTTLELAIKEKNFGARIYLLFLIIAIILIFSISFVYYSRLY